MLKRIGRSSFQFGPLLGLVAVFIMFCVLCKLRDAPFHSFYNVKTIVTQTVIVGIGALGMTMIIISGAIDLSVGSLIALTTVVVALVLRKFGVSEAGPGLWLPVAAVLAGMGAAAVCGVVNGVVISRLKIVSFIATLGMMQIARGLAKWLGRQQTVVAPENWLNDLMLVDPEPAWLVFAPGVWLMFVLLVLLHVLLKYTVFGRYIYAVGSNEATARLCGINVERCRIGIFAGAAAFTGVAGVMQYANLTVGDPTAAVGMELDIIAAVVIGGGSLNGGEGSAVGTLVGALIMAVLRNGCNMLGVPNYVQNIIIGAVIVGAVAVDSLKHRLHASWAA